MEAEKLIRALYRRGYRASVEGGYLELRGPRKLPASVRATVREHKAAILEALEGSESFPPAGNFDTSPTIRTTGEVLELARAHFGEIAPEYRQEAPYAAPEPGRDPMAHKHTDKALWFAGARERELERRRRYGLPSHIRLVDGGAS